MSRSIVETLIGAFVIAVAVLFLQYSYNTGNAGTPDGYAVFADFSGTGGLREGDDVQISGVKVGSVTHVDLVPETYLARVHMRVSHDLKLPVDSAALIGSESLMGGKYLQIEPGADEDLIVDGGRIEYTQAPQNLEQLLGKFIFSMNDKDGAEAEAESKSKSSSSMENNTESEAQSGNEDAL